MVIIINLASVFKGGAEQVAVSLINEFKSFKESTYHIFLRNNIAQQLDINSFPENFHFYFFKKRPASNLKTLFFTIKKFKKLEAQIKPDCVLSTGGHGYWKPKAPLIGGFNIPHYIYPESPFFKKLPFSQKLYWKTMRKVHLFFFNRLNAVVVQTNDVKSRVEKILSSKPPVFMVSNTVNSYFTQPDTFPGKLPERKPGEIRLLTLSSYYSHKNLEIIKEVIEKLKKKKDQSVHFILTLPEEEFKKYFFDADQKRIINIGPIPIKECPSLYNECDFMFLPTLLECFSASYAEAMFMNKPILTSDLSFAHTVCGNAAIYFDPLNPDEIADKIIWLSQRPHEQKKLIQAGKEKKGEFNTPLDRAKEFIEICKTISAK